MPAVIVVPFTAKVTATCYNSCMDNTISFPLEQMVLKSTKHSLEVWGTLEGCYFSGRFICHNITDLQKLKLSLWKAEKTRLLMCFDTFFGAMSEHVIITKLVLITDLKSGPDAWEINVEGTTPTPKT